MKKFGKELEFISWINRDGSGTVPVTGRLVELLEEEKFKLHCLSITQETFIINGFNSFVVKIKKPPNEQEDERSVARNDAQRTERRETK